MPTCNNLFNVRIVAVSSTGTVNLGNSVQVNPCNNSVSLGGADPVGDFSVNANNERSLYIDPDFASQLGRTFL
ncbi:spore germination protein [Baia soyae]|uniref:Spore germination protein GerPA/GerPF n=1 Tax=Baia soyae TaxID=1544746 RepID=A0A4R2RRH3_9BACL|nr:spore germination protein [Baia soyae]TCP65409.1 spore germination protein GerPA/GerPF [Baia soyae]